MHEHDRLSDYLKVAPLRLADAYELLEQPTWESNAHDAGHRHLRTAAYLAGYAVECALKAYIITIESAGLLRDEYTLTAAIQARRSRGNCPDLSGKRAHDLTLLLRVTGLESAMQCDERIRKQWGMLRKWKTEWRYDPRPYTSRRDARALVQAADALHAWLDGMRLAAEEDAHGSY